MVVAMVGREVASCLYRLDRGPLVAEKPARSGFDDERLGPQDELGSHHWRSFCTSYRPVHPGGPTPGIASQAPLTVDAIRVRVLFALVPVHARVEALFPFVSRALVLAHVSPSRGLHVLCVHESRVPYALFLYAPVPVAHVLFARARAAVPHVRVLFPAAPSLLLRGLAVHAPVVHAPELRLLRRPMQVVVVLHWQLGHDRLAQGGVDGDATAVGRRSCHDEKERVDADRGLVGPQVQGFPFGCRVEAWCDLSVLAC